MAPRKSDLSGQEDSGHRRTSSAPPIVVEDHSRLRPPEQADGSLHDDHTGLKHELHPASATGRSSTQRKSRHRARSPGVSWHQSWTKDSWKNGRVLIIDYVSREDTHEGRRKIVAQEFNDVVGLKKYYQNKDRSGQHCGLRVVHVQNASWATKFLLRKYHIDHRDDLVGTNFARWARYERPQIRAKKPVLNGKTWKPQRDPWRGISRTAFGVDYLKHFPARNLNDDRHDQDPETNVKMMELNHYNEIEEPAYGYDVYIQRLSVYIQRSEAKQRTPSDPSIRNPYNDFRFSQGPHLKSDGATTIETAAEHAPSLKSLDNGNVIIIFEHSESGSEDDTLIGARQQIESRWRRLTFYMSNDDTSSDDRLATQCLDLILNDIFKALATAWDEFLDVCETHVSILEDKIYEDPADESRAAELWTNSSLWLKVEKLMFIHIDIIREMKNHMKEIDDLDNASDEWLGSSVEEFEKLRNLIQEDLVKPTSSLSDLMYKSVEIRDSRQSLELNASLWRLSWITFIFLPLTFTVGFFGMNVDVFANNPSIAWYFIISLPFMLLVLVVWFMVKYAISSRRQTPYQRGIYEDIFHELATEHPRLWNRNGPRADVRPDGFLSSIKWRLVRAWYSPEKTVRKPTTSAINAAGLGTIEKIKRSLIRRWLNEIAASRRMSLTATELGEVGSEGDESAITELVALSTPSMVAAGEPGAVPALSKTLSEPLRFRRSSSPGSSAGIMVDERDLSDEYQSEGSNGHR